MAPSAQARRPASQAPKGTATPQRRTRDLDGVGLRPNPDTVACSACDPGGGTEPLLACLLTSPRGIMIPLFPGRAAARIREDVCKVPGAGAGTRRCSKVAAARIRDSGPGLQTTQGSVSAPLLGVSRAAGSRQSVGELNTTCACRTPGPLSARGKTRCLSFRRVLRPARVTPRCPMR